MLVGDDLTIALFLIATGVSVAAIAVSAAGWKHPLFINSLFVVAGALAVGGLAWPWAKTISPPVGEIIREIARSPVAWFMQAS
jgi:hypothetical protein